MRVSLMISASVAALVAAGGLVSAQGMNERREQPTAATPEHIAPEGKADRQKLNAPQKSESVKPAPSAQLPEGKVDQRRNATQKVKSEKPAPSTQSPANAPQKSESVKQPSAQLPATRNGAKAETTGQGGSAQPAQHSPQPLNERTTPNAAAQAESKPGTPAALSPGHHAQIRETIRSQKVAPLTDVQFSVTVGQVVPRTVHLNRLPSRIVEYAPQYRGYEYILVGDEILIVDPRTLRIVAVIAA